MITNKDVITIINKIKDIGIDLDNRHVAFKINPVNEKEIELALSWKPDQQIPFIREMEKLGYITMKMDFRDITIVLKKVS